MATLDDIARELAVSKSTVSKALSGARDVSKVMRQTVLEKAVELGYTRISRSGERPRIALFITNMEYDKPEDFGYELVLSFRKAAEPAGYQVDIIPLDRELQTSIHYDEYMVLGSYRGGLFLGLSLPDPWIGEFATCRTPTVLYDNHIVGNPNVTHVGVDNAEGMGLAVSLLKELGHKKVGYLGSALEAYVYQQRYHAFFRAVQENGLTADEKLAGCDLRISVCLADHLPRLLAAGCTAIVCSHDILAQSVMERCAELGFRVPEDLSIIGFDDLPLCEQTRPPLTTIRQDRCDLGRSCFYALNSQMNRVPLSTFLLHTELIRRGSCGPAEAEKTTA